jgi:hypothetical protein
MFLRLTTLPTSKSIALLMRSALLSLTLIAGNALVVDLAYAEDTKAEKEKKLKYRNAVTQRRKSVSTVCGKKLQKVQGLFEEEDWAGAETLLQGALKRGCTRGYDQTQVYRFMGHVYYSLERIDDAITTYMKLVDSPDADPQQRTKTRYNVSQLMFVTENYEGAVKQLEQWRLEAEIVDKGGLILLAKGYYALERKDDALALVEEVMAEVKAADQVPKETWLSFQWVLYYEKGLYKETLPVSNLLLTHYTKVKYWKQIAAMYGALENVEKEMLSLELTYLQNGLDQEKQLIALAYQYMAFDVPYRAATVIKKGMDDGIIERSEKNLEVLGSAYQRSQEYRMASPVLEAAAKKSSEGNVWARLASVYLNLNENEKALVAAKNAIKKGKLKREGVAWMSRGSAEAALHCYDDAAKSFKKATKFERTKRGAASWMQYVENEGSRRTKLISNGAKLATCKKA